jgi:hypothetical protein
MGDGARGLGHGIDNDYPLMPGSARAAPGWVLSRSTQDRMKAQLDPQNSDAKAEACSFDNAGNLDRIRARVSAAAGK